jgi:hypothetical protein
MNTSVMKFRFLFFVILINMICISSFAQVNFIFNTTANGRDMKGLSTVQIINTTAENLIGNLEIEVKSGSNTSAIVKATIPALNVLTGNNIIPYNKFSTAAIYYSSSTEGNYLKQTNMMPEGELEYCFKFTVTSKNNAGDVFDNCFVGLNTIGTPLELVLPDDKDNFCNKRPNFSWRPSLPLIAGVSYSLKLVEKLPNQSLAEAVLVNTAIVFQNNVKGFSLPYPSGAKELKEDKTYVWQVTAYSKARQSVSDVWEFTIQCDPNKNEPINNSFRELTAQDDGGYLSTGAQLRFALYNAYISGILNYSIKDLVNPQKKLKGMPSINLQQGINNITLDLNKVAGMEDGNEYLLKVVLPDGKEVSLRFKYSDGE